MREVDELADLITPTDPAAAEEVRIAGRRAVTLEHGGDDDEAGEQYLRMVEPARGSAPVYRYAALRLVGMGRCGDALELADGVAQLNGRDPDAYRVLGEVCEGTGAYAAAALAYREALELGQGRDADVRFRLAHMLHNLGRRAGARLGAHVQTGADDVEAQRPEDRDALRPRAGKHGAIGRQLSRV